MKFLRNLILLTGVIIITLFSVYYVTIYIKTIGKDYEVIVDSGEGTNEVLGKIGLKNNIVVKVHLFITGKYKNFKPGNFSIRKNNTVNESIDILAKGRDSRARITIPEGYSISQIKKRLSEKGLIDPQVFDGVLENIKDFPYPHENNFEGYFFPATYYFYKGEGEEKIIRAFLDKFLEVYPFEIYGNDEKFYEKLIVASLVEKEAKYDDERALVASVFYNRLRRHMKLQSCATVEYLYDFTKEKLYYKDLEIDSPYNTYKNKGLPPTPISNPGKKSMIAAMKPKTTKYLYFVVSQEGRHHFSEDYKEHMAAQGIIEEK